MVPKIIKSIVRGDVYINAICTVYTIQYTDPRYIDNSCMLYRSYNRYRVDRFYI